MRLCICNPSTQQMEARESGVQGHPGLCIDFEASLGYLSICLKKSDSCVCLSLTSLILGRINIYTSLYFSLGSVVLLVSWFPEGRRAQLESKNW